MINLPSYRKKLTVSFSTSAMVKYLISQNLGCHPKYLQNFQDLVNKAAIPAVNPNLTQI